LTENKAQIATTSRLNAALLISLALDDGEYFISIPAGNYTQRHIPQKNLVIFVIYDIILGRCAAAPSKVGAPPKSAPIIG
jgi:hypothetical protein